jgi:NTE family protein
LAKDNALTLVQLIYRRNASEGGTRDFEFSRQTMLDHWAAGVEDVTHVLSKRISKAKDDEVAVFDPGKDRETIPG